MMVRRIGAPALQRRVRTGKVPRLPQAALAGAETLERRTLPRVFLGGLVGLVFVQLWLALI